MSSWCHTSCRYGLEFLHVFLSPGAIVVLLHIFMLSCAFMATTRMRFSTSLCLHGIMILSSSASSCPPGAIMVLCCSTSSWCYVSFWPHTCFSMGSCLHGVGCLHGTITLCSSASRCPPGVTRPYVIMVLSSSMSCCPPGVVMFHVFMVSRAFTATCVCFSMLSCLRDIGPLHGVTSSCCSRSPWHRDHVSVSSWCHTSSCHHGLVLLHIFTATRVCTSTVPCLHGMGRLHGTMSSCPSTSRCPPGVPRPRVTLVLCCSVWSRPHTCVLLHGSVSSAVDVLVVSPRCLAPLRSSTFVCPHDVPRPCVSSRVLMFLQLSMSPRRRAPSCVVSSCSSVSSRCHTPSWPRSGLSVAPCPLVSHVLVSSPSRVAPRPRPGHVLMVSCFLMSSRCRMSS